MNLFVQSVRWHRVWRCGVLVAAVCSLAGSASWLAAQSAGNAIAWIDGDSVTVKGSPSASPDSATTALALISGSEVTVRTGRARLAFADGSEVGVCGPASFSVLQTGHARTIALNSGRVHLRMAGPGSLLVLTPLVTATPIALGPDGAREATVGVDAEGSFCAWSGSGAMRLEHQLTSQALVVPQSGEITLPGGQLDALLTSRGACGCDALLARKSPPPVQRQAELAALTLPTPTAQSKTSPAALPVARLPASRTELSVLASPPPKDPNHQVQPALRTPATEEPNWLVLMPPLTFDPNKPSPPDPGPEGILLLREARVSPHVVFSGRVAANQPPATFSQTTVATAKAEAKPKSSGGFFRAIGSFFGRLFGRKPKTMPCSGSGCP